MQRLLLIMICAAVLTGAVREAEAQTPRVERPYRGLFGGNVPDPAKLLEVTAGVGGGYDTNVLLDNTFGGGTGTPRVGVGSPFAGLTAGLNYVLHGTRLDLGASASTAARYYTDLADPFVASHNGSVAATVQFTKSSTFTASQTITYQPFLSLFALPPLYDPSLGQVPPTNIDLGTADQAYVDYRTNAAWSQRVTRRGSLTFSYSYQLSDFSQGATVGDFSSSLAAGRFSYNIGRGLSARVGYGYEDARYDSTENGDYTGSTFDAGVDFNRALSLSRRTTLTFATGSSASSYQGATYYRFLGNARLTREFGRTWSAGLAYDRTIELQAAYPEPVLGDSATLGVSGMINRRLQFSSSVGVFFGNVGFTGAANGFETHTGSCGLTMALTRNLGIFGSYTYYGYSYEEDALPPGLVGLPYQTNRHSVQASLVVWAPLFYRPRKPNVTR